MKCLIVEDDYEIASLVKQSLIEMDATVDIEFNGRQAYERAISNNYDIIILDLMLPDMDGYTFTKSLREKEIHAPILILSALRELDDRLKGLNLGADDYLSKPFATAELQIRVKNLLKRSQNISEVTQLIFQDLKLNRLNRNVIRGEKKLDLLSHEFALLDLLMSNPNKILCKQTILKEVWNYDFDPQTNIVDVLVCRLRSKMERNFPTRMLYTVRGVGYILKSESSNAPRINLDSMTLS
ncbi:response regulator [Bdellovibrio svalbardensis]|uniref:Response regulator transcription factor n=1 Tax=Bdellovibrio svalbardensis TaxID=2972972 RepID=A0ABT6DL15_9BACT|nr:response regulator transcription factor [Bdellovibrio svalbardensis]MDG0815808.1 response regulator transcription factor [Bdellovibrio svalbardensis]